MRESEWKRERGSEREREREREREKEREGLKDRRIQRSAVHIVWRRVQVVVRNATERYRPMKLIGAAVQCSRINIERGIKPDTVLYPRSSLTTIAGFQKKKLFEGKVCLKKVLIHCSGALHFTLNCKVQTWELKSTTARENVGFNCTRQFQPIFSGY